jgi:hypothetical protein
MSATPYAAFAALLITTPALAAPLNVVNVNAPAVNCVFNPACTITVTDTVGTFSIPGIAGMGRLQSRTFTGVGKSPGTGKRGYMYRVNMTQTAGFLNQTCVTELKLTFGPVSQLNYNPFPPLDDVFVITTGGIGTIGVAWADKVGNEITFGFTAPVCSGNSIGTGDSSRFFGLASTKGPKNITAQVNTIFGPGWINVAARAPNF